ncbi:hypothetical protein EDD18DRAFT_1351848 [Armillaria luteobubalina]|uniref:Ribonuclease H1 N-terminal domain-containing protein n=1 Tax=Armillaria luteobubalina TaxID=153913 RepID=A0AA39Q939_9AGAR|nr:hypothetical protein EDD18DRAFT_1351848 [Armillaria luteobubalina]
MTQFSYEQLVAALSALGISPSTTGAAAAYPVPMTAPVGQAGSPLLAVHCSNCAFPNVVAASAIPTMVALAVSTTSRGPPARATGRAPAACSASSPYMTMDGAGSPSAAHLPHVAATPASVAPASVAPAPVTPPAYAPSQPQPGASVGPDGPWYVIVKGRSVGVFKGWQIMSSLVTGVGRACYFRLGTRIAAQAAFDEAFTTGTMEVLH